MTEAVAPRRVDTVGLRLLIATMAWVALYGLVLVALPAGLPGRSIIADSVYVPGHALAAMLLWRVAAPEVEKRRRTGFQLLVLSQVFGVLNAVLWVLSSGAYIALNAPIFQYAGMAMVVTSVAGVASLVPKRSVAGDIAVVPAIDATLLALASLAVGWQFVGAPLLRAGGESANDFLWFAALTAADTFTGLLALGAWAFSSPRIRSASALLLVASFGLSAWLDVVIQVVTADGSYVSGGRIDIMFAVAVALIAVAGYMERTPPPAAPSATSRRAELMRLLLPFVAATAVLVPVIAQAETPVQGPVRFLPFALLLVFLALVQWRYLLLEQAAEAALTSRMALERDLRLSQQFESLGRYAASVAHDMNNLLAALLAQVHLARYLEAKSPPAVADETLSEMEKTLSSGTTLVRRLTQMSRGGETPAVSVDLTRAARSFAITVARLLPANVRLSLELATAPVLVMLRPGDVDQLLLNLVVNARDALPAGGNITVRIRADGPVAELEVVDDGVGIAPEMVGRIFEPFFTTRLGQGGTGLGLATVQSIVAQSGGSVDASSAPASGTRFTVRWPIASPG